LWDWSKTVTAVLPNGTTTITCNNPVLNTNPGSCKISISWTENRISGDNTTNTTQLQNTGATNYILWVDP